jgi:hypothetical protein
LTLVGPGLSFSEKGFRIPGAGSLLEADNQSLANFGFSKSQFIVSLNQEFHHANTTRQSTFHAPPRS